MWFKKQIKESAKEKIEMEAIKSVIDKLMEREFKRLEEERK